MDVDQLLQQTEDYCNKMKEPPQARIDCRHPQNWFWPETLKLHPKIVDAMQLCVSAHGTKQRKNTGMPYWTHPFKVWMMTAKLVDQWEIGCAALLHDTVEDTTVTDQQINTEFGSVVSDTVKELTNDKLSPDIAETKKRMIERSLTFSCPAVIIKCMDRIDNLTDFASSSCPIKTLVRYTEEACKLCLNMMSNIANANRDQPHYQPARIALDMLAQTIENVGLYAKEKGIPEFSQFVVLSGSHCRFWLPGHNP